MVAHNGSNYYRKRKQNLNLLREGYRKRKQNLNLLREGYAYLFELRKLTNAIQAEGRYGEKNKLLREAKGKNIVLDPREEKILDGLFEERHNAGMYLLYSAEDFLKELHEENKKERKMEREVMKEKTKTVSDILKEKLKTHVDSL